MPTVTNPALQKLAASARRAWKKSKREPNVEYAIEVNGRRIIAWTHISAPSAVLHTMSVQSPNDGLLYVTHLQVRHDGHAVRSITRPALNAELEKWFRFWPDDRQLLKSEVFA
jgi:hypothetical protein